MYLYASDVAPGQFQRLTCRCLNRKLGAACLVVSDLLWCTGGTHSFTMFPVVALDTDMVRLGKVQRLPCLRAHDVNIPQNAVIAATTSHITFVFDEKLSHVNHKVSHVQKVVLCSPAYFWLSRTFVLALNYIV